MAWSELVFCILGAMPYCGSSFCECRLICDLVFVCMCVHVCDVTFFNEPLYIIYLLVWHKPLLHSLTAFFDFGLQLCMPGSCMPMYEKGLYHNV